MDWIVENYQKTKSKALTLGTFYHAELQFYLSKNLRKIQAVSHIWKCRLVSCIWLYALFLSIPLTLSIFFVKWILAWKQGKLPNHYDLLIGREQRKNVLITGGASPKGKFTDVM